MDLFNISSLWKLTTHGKYRPPANSSDESDKIMPLYFNNRETLYEKYKMPKLHLGIYKKNIKKNHLTYVREKAKWFPLLP